MAVEGEYAGDAETFGCNDERSVGKIHGSIRILAHEDASSDGMFMGRFGELVETDFYLPS